jgi:membrane protein
MELVFWVTFSNEVVSDYEKYGPIGAVFAFMSFFVAIGVVILVGAMFGIVWQERALSWNAAWKRLTRKRTVT